MVQNKPKIKEIIPNILSIIDKYPIVGHGINFDINLLKNEANRAGINCSINKNKQIDTLRLARLYGQSPSNSLERLRKHFNIEDEGAHRAMSDVIVNIEVFKYLTSSFKTVLALYKRLEKPILLKNMPLGKHKGRKFEEIPIEYLRWALKKDFDLDLVYSIKTELKKRTKKNNFFLASNPFSNLANS